MDLFAKTIAVALAHAEGTWMPWEDKSAFLAWDAGPDLAQATREWPIRYGFADHVRLYFDYGGREGP